MPDAGWVYTVNFSSRENYAGALNWSSEHTRNVHNTLWMQNFKIINYYCINVVIIFSLETLYLFGASLLRAGLGNLMYAFVFAKWDKGTFGVLLLGAGGWFNHQVKEKEGSPGDSSLLPRVGSLGRQWSSQQESKALWTHGHLLLMWFRSSTCNDPGSGILELEHPFILDCFWGRNSTKREKKQNSPSIGWFFLRLVHPLVPQGSSLLQYLLYQRASCPHAKPSGSRPMEFSSCKDKTNAKKECHNFWDSECNPADSPHTNNLLIQVGIAAAEEEKKWGIGFDILPVK